MKFINKNSQEIGIMPFFSPYAFVYVDKTNSPQEFSKTSGHELGHGAFGLEHPFTHHQGLDEFGMENLMSWHPTATKLCKYQWDLIQHPAYWLEGKYGSGESEAMVGNFAPTDRQFVLYIYSPIYADSFLVYNSLKDIYNQRRITYWLLNRKFPDNFVARKILYDAHDPINNYAASLHYNIYGKKGVTVYLYKYKEVEGRKVGSIYRSPKNLQYDANNGVYEDVYYPVDINLYCGEGKPANGDLYYGKYDFIGKYAEASLIFGKLGRGSGLIVGRMRGYGYCEYYYKFKGKGYNISAISFGQIRGVYKGDRGNQKPEDLAGEGITFSFGISASQASWKSYKKNGTLIFEGTSEGWSLGTDPGSLVKLQTETCLLFPKLKN